MKNFMIYLLFLVIICLVLVQALPNNGFLQQSNQLNNNNNSFALTTVSLGNLKHVPDITKVVYNFSRNRKMIEIVGKKLNAVWKWIQSKGQNENTFIGRCLGFGRKLKMIMPMLVFKLGVIVTMLVFLTLFSLKALGLLVTLLVLNVGGFASKLALLKGHHHSDQKQQTVHFHIHQNKDGSYHTSHSGPGVSAPGWIDRYDEPSSDSTSFDPELYSLYQKLGMSPYGRSLLNSKFPYRQFR